MILILTHNGDSTADMVITRLQSLGADFIRFNTEEFPQKSFLELRMSGSDIRGKIVINESAIDINSINSIWNRRPHKPKIDPRITNQAIRDWAAEESDQALKILWSLLSERFWMNSLEVNALLDSNKWLQMRGAVEVGLRIPDSLITNISSDALAFCEEQNKTVALKAIKQEVIRYADKRTTMIMTKRLGEAEITWDNFRGVALTPSFLQQYVEKEKELRITVVGKKIFCCDINSQQTSGTKEDWRAHIITGKAPSLMPYDLPPSIERKCIELLERLRLPFGCIDMIITPEGEYVFLEVNPNGQWAWVEQKTGLPISDGIAHFLIEHD